MSKCLLFSTTLSILSDQDLKKIERAYFNLNQLLSPELINKNLLNKLDEIIVNLIKFVYDSDYLQEIFFDLNVVMVEPDLIHYSVETMLSIFEHLQVFFFVLFCNLNCRCVYKNYVSEKIYKRPIIDLVLH